MWLSIFLFNEVLNQEEEKLIMYFCHVNQLLKKGGFWLKKEKEKKQQSEGLTFQITSFTVFFS